MKIEIFSALVILLIAAFIDWKEHRIPNWLTCLSLCFALLYHVMISGLSGINTVLLGVAVGFATLIIPYALNAMGAGDVKLMMAVGAWVGARDTFQAFLWVAIIGGVMGIYIVLHNGKVKEKMDSIRYAGEHFLTLKPMEKNLKEIKNNDVVLPYGIPIALGFTAYFLIGGLI